MVQLQKNVILNKGDFEKHLLPTGIDITSIKADKPIMVYKLGGFDRELGGGLLTPIADCKGTHLLAFQYPTLAVEAVFSFVAPDAILGNFLLNGNSSIITAADFFTHTRNIRLEICKESCNRYFYSLSGNKY